ncbi:hypothetical protein TNCT_384291 [Trichonephila clavata]|uniref:Uncharacterized protein n=1 Tax=Trichonephila clavata TaxID=2740835 RepID=A0A8X6H6D4_TRICU|nr:hypothetical protein TNCT_384291 [Trichonephila clavata]
MEFIRTPSFVNNGVASLPNEMVICFSFVIDPDKRSGKTLSFGRPWRSTPDDKKDPSPCACAAQTGVDANSLRNPFVCGRLGPPRVKVKRESESALLEWAFVMGFSGVFLELAGIIPRKKV